MRPAAVPIFAGFAHGQTSAAAPSVPPAPSPNTRAFVVHGEPEQSEIFAQRLISELAAKSAAVPAAYTTVFT